ncbi:MAG: LysM peptidoglycan-binding domain-containing protein [Acidimicrobiales bacterium]
MTIQKAFLEAETRQRIPCLFNPDELSLTRGNMWTGSSLPGKGVPVLDYQGATSGSLTLNLVFDTTNDGSPVTDHTNKLLLLMEIDTSLPGYDEESGNGRPPWVQFHWGDFHSFKSVITDLSLTFTYFSSDGVPLRARVELTLEQFEPDDNWGRQNPTSGTPRPHRTHIVQPGETLDRIAAKHYGTSTPWRDIAAANGIEDPLALRPGTMLAIPQRVDAAGGT